jgi:gliding motility-associated-like protein
VVIASGGGGSALTYNWSNGAQGARVSFLPKGDYSVTVTDENNCSVTGAYTINEPEPLKVEVSTEPANDGCNGSAMATIVGGTAPFTYQWNAGLSSNATQTNLCPGDYMVVVTDANGCSNQQTPTLLSVKDRRFPCIESSVVITPDGDGLNEEFIINCIEELANNNVKIFNRWGQLVFEIDNYDNTWDGRTNDGAELPDGPYYYIIEYDENNNRQQVKGSISVLRE